MVKRAEATTAKGARNFTRTLLLLALVVTALWLAYMSFLFWGFAHGHEAHFVSSTTCVPRGGGFSEARISVKGSVAPHHDLATTSSADVVLMGNHAERVAFHVETDMIESSTPQVAPGSDTSARLSRNKVLSYFEAVGYPRMVERGALDESVAQEFMDILAYARGGPKTEPLSGEHFRIASHSATYTDP